MTPNTHSNFSKFLVFPPRLLTRGHSSWSPDPPLASAWTTVLGFTMFSLHLGTYQWAEFWSICKYTHRHVQQSGTRLFPGMQSSSGKYQTGSEGDPCVGARLRAHRLPAAVSSRWGCQGSRTLRRGVAVPLSQMQRCTNFFFPQLT
jgi:hypothetical protein